MAKKKSMKVWEEEIKSTIKTNNWAAIKALVIIYHNQSAEEKTRGLTTGTNKKGFGKYDAEYMTRLVINLRQYGTISRDDMAILRNKIAKYWRQLVPIAKGEQDYPEGVRGTLNYIKDIHGDISIIDLRKGN